MEDVVSIKPRRKAGHTQRVYGGKTIGTFLFYFNEIFLICIMLSDKVYI
jgi:hypothetical protein